MPSVFLSSTVTDFEDLRGALRDWLQLKGFDVLASDATEFDKGGDSNSYTACLAAIKKADHFVLLVGDRRGGIYQEASEPISITRAEYRAAYDESTRRHLPIHAFVRKRTWNEKHLYEIGRLTPNENLLHQTAFLREVGRVSEMKIAVSGQQGRPPNNWIHQFDSFSDLRSALEVNLGLRHDLETQVLRHGASLELEVIVAHFLRKVEPGRCHWRSDVTRTLREKAQIPLPTLSQMVDLPRKDAANLFIATLGQSSDLLPDMQTLERATYWPRFAEHDPIRGSTKMSAMQKAISRVLFLLKKLRLSEEVLSHAHRHLDDTLSASEDKDGDVQVSIHAIDVATIFSYTDDLDRLKRNLISLGAFFILGLPYSEPGEEGIARCLPIDGLEEQVREHEILTSDVQTFLADLFRASD